MKEHTLLLCLVLVVRVKGQLLTDSAATYDLHPLLTENDPCPLWQTRNISAGRCMCESISLEGIVICRDKPYNLALYECFCMSFNNVTNLTLVGSCQYTCNKESHGHYWNITVNASVEVDEHICSKYKRQDQLCGGCIPGYAPPVYSYFLFCVNCSSSNWAKYTAVSLLPVTAFFFFVITFRLSATSPKLNGFILFTQLFMSPPNARLTGLDRHQSNRMTITIITSIYGIWNLDFFRLVYTPFCVQPHTDTLQVLALDYIIAVYPLILIAFSYLLVLLYDRNVRLIVCLWKPFVPLFVRFQREWNIRNSLVQVFATFFLLSYVKVLSVSADLLMPVLLFDQKGHTISQLYLFNQGDVPFLGSQHLPYACLALFFLLTFTLLPILLLFLYPCSCFQVCLNRTGCSCQVLHTFMDTFQGHYKNGTNGTRDLRFFSGLYLLLRVVVYASTVLSYQITSFAYTRVCISVLAFGVALARPYKLYVYTVIDTLFLAITITLYDSLGPTGFGQPHWIVFGLAPITYVILLIPVIYITVLLVHWWMSWRCVSQFWYTLHQRFRGNEQQHPLIRAD